MDYFALLGQPRQPWLDAEALKAAFLEISAREHPDRVHGAGMEERAAATARYAELNAAYQRLRDARERLGYLLELELGARPGNVQQPPAEVMEFFAKTGGVCREADKILARKPAEDSPLPRAQWFVESVAITAQLADLQQQIRWQREELVAELRGMNESWKTAPPPGDQKRAGALPLRRLEEIYRIFSFTGRWSAQLEERFAQFAI